MIDPELNNQVLKELDNRINALEQVAKNPNLSTEAKKDATNRKEELIKEKELRKQVANAKSSAQKEKAEKALAAYRKTKCPGADDGSSIAKCQPSVLYVHLHMRFLLPEQLVKDMRNTSKYPLRAVNCPADVFKKNYSFEGIPFPSRKRWGGDHPVVGATVTLGDKTAKTNKSGVAKFENVASGAYLLVITPPENMQCISSAGPDLPAKSGAYDYDKAPDYMYRAFNVIAVVNTDSKWDESKAPVVQLTHKGQAADYASVVGVTAADLFLDWKPDWLKVENRKKVSTRTKSAILLHQTATTSHEQVGSPIFTFKGSAGTAAHYLVDLDGHVIKLVHEDEKAVHANSASHWHNLSDLDIHGIGIENVHTDYNLDKTKKFREFTTEQYSAINRLLSKLRSEFKIPPSHVCGHNDCRDGSRECPGDMFDWKSIEDAGNALKTLYGGTFTGSRVIEPKSKTANDAKFPLSQMLYQIGYTNKTVEEALSRFLRRAWSGSRLKDRPKKSHETVTIKQPTKPKTPAKVVVQHLVTQDVSDAIMQMFNDLQTKKPSK